MTVTSSEEHAARILQRARERGLLPPASSDAEAPEGLERLIELGILSHDVVEALAAELASDERRTEPSSNPAGGGGAGTSWYVGRFPVPGWERYEILELLGAGGMGMVFKARDPRLKRFVAIKVLHRDDPALIERFLLEARAQARVEHEGICRVYEVGQVGTHHFIAMQYIDGRALSALGSELSIEQKALLIRQVAEALHAAHRTGLVHRDVKPGNVLVEARPDGSLRPWVVDFGLARDLGGEHMTMTGMVVGTADYMAPEQARGDATHLDRRTDIYSIGATLYELLCGRPPFVGGSKLEVLMKAINEEPTRPRRIDPSIPSDLEDIVLTCLEKEPQRRYPSARALAEDLQRFLDGEAVVARPSGWAATMWRRARAHKPAAALALAATVLVVGLGGYSVASRLELRAREKVAAEMGADVRYVEETMRRSMSAPAHDIRREKERIRARLDGIRARMANGSRLHLGPGSYALGRGHLALGDYREARAHLERAWQAGYRRPEVAYALGRTLGALYQHALEDAERVSDRAQREQRRRSAERELRTPALAALKLGGRADVESSAYVMGLIAFYEERHGEALRLAEQAAAEVPWLYEAALLQAEVRVARGRSLQGLGAYDDAAAEYDRAGEAFARASSIARSDPAVLEGECQRWIEVMGLRLKRGADPEPATEGAIAACRAALAIDPDASGPYNKLSAVYWHLGDWQNDHGIDPRSALQSSVELADQALRAAPGDIVALRNRGCALTMLGRFLLERGEDPREPLTGAVTSFAQAATAAPTDAALFNEMGYAYDRLARYETGAGLDPRPALDNAVAAYRRAVEISPDYSNAHNTMGIAYWRQGEYALRTGADPEPALEAAIASYRRALAINPSYAYAFSNLGAALRCRARDRLERGVDPTGALAEARDAFARSLEIKPDIYWVFAELVDLELLAARWAMVLRGSPEPHFSAAERALPRGLALNAANAEIHHAAAALHYWRAEWMRQQGTPTRTEVRSGLEDVRAALAINPRRGDTLALAGQLHLLAASTSTGATRRSEASAAARSFEQARARSPLLAREIEPALAVAQSMME